MCGAGSGPGEGDVDVLRLGAWDLEVEEDLVWEEWSLFLSSCSRDERERDGERRCRLESDRLGERLLER